MGNKDSKPATSLADWEKVDTDNGIQIYRNKKNNQLAQKRPITIDPHYDLNDELKIYHMRQHNRDALVRSFGTQNIDKKSSSEGLCSGHKKIFVLTEKMPYRLSQLPQLTFPQCLLFLRQSLRAYSKVFKNYGPIHITKHLIGINHFGEVRCWVNENWALNHPDNDFPSLQSTKLQDLTKQQYLAYGAKYRDETEMVHNICAVVQQKCQQGKFPQAFYEQVQQHSSSFKKLQLYLQDFVNYNEIFIPPKINYETVFVSKYQTRLAQQHQLSGQNKAKMQQNNNQQSESINQVAKKETLNTQMNQQNTAAYISNQQLQNKMQNYGYGITNQQNNNLINQNNSSFNTVTRNQQQQSNVNTQLGYNTKPVQQGPNASTNFNYTGPTFSTGAYQANNMPANNTSYNITKTTTTSTYGGLNQGDIGTGGGSLYSTNSGNGNLWSNTQSVYKPAQTSQNKYITSYNQYSNLNQQESGTTGGNYNFGGILGGTETSTKYQVYKPSSYTNLNSGANSNASYNFSNSNNYGTYGNVGYGNDKSNSFTIGNTKNYGGIYNNQATYTVPQSGVKYNTYAVTNTTTGYAEPTYGSSAQKGSTYSFDGRQDFSSKFGGYTGSGYSNTLSKYENTGQNSDNRNKQTKIEGKYAQAFNSLLSPTLRTQAQQTGQNSGGYTITTTQRVYSSNTPKSNVKQGQNSQKINENVLQNLAKMVERKTNEISESADVQF